MNLARFYRARAWEGEGKKIEAFSDLSMVNEQVGFPPFEN